MSGPGARDAGQEKHFELKDIEEALSTHTVRCATKLCRQSSCATGITVFLMMNRFAVNEHLYCNSRTIQLPRPTNSELELPPRALHLLKGMFRPGKRYVKVGIMLTSLIPASEVQLDLFSNQNGEKHSKLMSTLDTLRQRFGHHVLKYAMHGNKDEKEVEEEKRAAWMLQKKFLSSLYTTSVQGLLLVKN